MLTLPKVIDRPQRSYVAVRTKVTMADLPRVAPERIGAFFAWLEQRAIEPASPMFFKYNVIDMEGELEIDMGVETTAPVAGEGDFVAGELPSGRYAALTWLGPYDKLYDVNAVLIGWAKERRIRFDVRETARGDAFACRLEIYKNDVREEPDTSKWETELAIRLSDTP